MSNGFPLDDSTRRTVAARVKAHRLAEAARHHPAPVRLTEIPVGLCQCGCGKQTRIADRTIAIYGTTTGVPRRFIPGHNRRLAQLRPNTYRTRDGKLEHVAIAERVLGRRLPVGAEVHHVDQDHANNRHSNLVICNDHAYHHLLHVRRATLKAGGDPNTEKECSSCRRMLPFTAFYAQRKNFAHGRGGWCCDCCKARRKARNAERLVRP